MSTRNVFARIILKDLVSTGAKKVNASLKKTHKTAVGLDKTFSSLNSSMVGFAASATGIAAILASFQQLFSGVRYVEELNQSIVTMTGFVSTFSKAGQEGDFVRAFQEANEYAEALIPKLEIMDAKTIATGRDLTLMAETMAQYGVWIDLNNQKQEEGFVNMANALAMLTAGQQKQIQMRQEMHALLSGQMRMTDRLPKVLNRIIPNMREQVALWIESGEAVERIGEALKGFGMVVPKIQQMWAAIGTTMQTIHRRVLRGAMEPAYKDLLGLAARINESLMDQDGNLTKLAQQLQGGVKLAWIEIKTIVEGIYGLTKSIYIALEPLAVLGEWGAVGLTGIMEGLKNLPEIMGESTFQTVEFMKVVDKSLGKLSLFGKEQYSIKEAWKDISEAYQIADKGLKDEGGRVLKIQFDRVQQVLDAINQIKKGFPISGGEVDVTIPEAGVTAIADRHEKILKEMQKETDKFSKTTISVWEKINRSIFSSDKKMAKKNITDKLALDIEYWNKLADESKKAMKESYLARRNIIIEGNKKSFQEEEKLMMDSQEKQLKAYLAGIKGRENARRLEGEFIARQRIELTDFEKKWLSDSVESNVEYQQKIGEINKAIAGAKVTAAQFAKDEALNALRKQLNEEHNLRAQNALKVREMQRKNVKAVKDMMHGLGRGLMDEQQLALDDLMESYAKAVEQMDQLEFFSEDPQTLENIKALREQYGVKFVADLKKLGFEATNFGKIMKTVEQSMEDGMVGAFMNIGKGMDGLRESAVGMLKSISAEIFRLTVAKQIASGVSNVMQGISWGAATGAILNGSFQPVKAFANGATRIDKATLGWVGEGKYPEAIVPLPDGRSIPVKMTGGGGGMIVNNNTYITVEGGEDMDETMATKLGRVLNDSIEAKMKRLLISEQLPGGILNPQGVS